MMQSFALTHRLLEPFGADVEIELARPLTDIEAEALRALDTKIEMVSTT